MSGEAPSNPGRGEALVADLTLSRPGGFVLRVALSLPRAVTVLLGPSGAGKSTALDLISGHALPTAGRLELDGQLLFERREGAPPSVNVPVQRRRIGYVMQSPGLFPHLDVRDNVGYGLAGWPRADRDQRVAELAEALQLAPLLGRWPRSLSGGERQRVALARALAPRPRALLLDEPLSAVDLPGRDALLTRLHDILGALAIPVLYVTHSVEEQRFFAADGRSLALRLQPAGGAIEVVAAG